MRKNFFMEGLVKQCNRLLREAIESPWLEVFETQVDTALENTV